jgi:hypothetical protein
MANEQMRGGIMKKIGPTFIAKDVPPKGDGAVRSQQSMNSFQSRRSVQPVKSRPTCNQVDRGRLQICVFKWQREHLQAVNREVRRKSASLMSGSTAANRRGMCPSNSAVASPVPAPISRISMPGPRLERSLNSCHVSSG